MSTMLAIARFGFGKNTGSMRMGWVVVMGCCLLCSACASIRPHGPPCTLIDDPAVLGAEDITIDPETGVAFISVDHRLRKFSQDPRKRAPGTIFTYDLTTSAPTLRALPEDLEAPFHPHGIGLYTGADGEKRLFVVNHPEKKDDTVEIFHLRNDSLVYETTVRDSLPYRDRLMHSPNDVIPVGPRSFYVTNWQGARSTLGKLWEAVWGLRKSYVLYYDGSAFRKVVPKVRYANGINLSHDGQTLYLAPSREGGIFVYQRQVDGSLTKTQTIRVDTNPDNLEVDEHGNLWIGAHPRSFTFALYGIGLKKRSPSQVIKIPSGTTKFGQAEEIYLEEGRHLSASSVAAVYKDRLLIGSVFEGFLDCRLP